jgi:hypothetical protein
MDQDMWDEIKAILDRGESPRIVVSPSMRVITPKGPVGGRRAHPMRIRVRDGVLVNGRESGYIMTPDGWGLRCRNFGCNKRVPVRGKYGVCCCGECAAELKEFCETILGVLDGKIPPDALPSRFRNMQKRKKSGAKAKPRACEEKFE